jgi:hypothetical protein
MTKKKEPAWKSQAEVLLRDIAQAKTILDDISAKRQAAIDAAARPYDEQAAVWGKSLAVMEANLTALMKKNKVAMFDWARVVKEGQFSAGTASDRLNLKTGMLRYGIENCVVKARNMLDQLKQKGRNDLIIIVEKPDWDKIEGLDAAGLDEIGAQRKIKERFSYDVKPFIAEGK